VTKEYYKKATNLLENYELLNKTIEFDKEKFYNEMFLDKKAQDNKIRFVLPCTDSSVKITSEVTKEEIFAVI
jgi:3-dehydroquinate synthase